MKTWFSIILLLLFGSNVLGQLRIATWNTATAGGDFAPSFPRSSVISVLSAIGQEEVNGIARPIDVLLLQEQATLTQTTQAIVDSLNRVYGEGTYTRGIVSGRTNGGGRNAIVYNTHTVELIEEEAFGRLSVNAGARQSMQYILRPVGYGPEADFHAYVTHFKAGTSRTDQDRRTSQAAEVRTDANRLDADTHVIFAGDFNIRSCNEAMFRRLTAEGNAQAIDPVNPEGTNCSWNDSNVHRRWHTQSPADGSDGSLTRGGLDDRFDFQLLTDDFLDGEGLSLIEGSYRTFGNNGTHRLNQPVNDARNTAAPRAVLNALARASDHLPVVADYQLPARMEVSGWEVPELVIAGTPLSLRVNVSNAAPVDSPIGADELDFVATLERDLDPIETIMGSVDATETFAGAFDMPTSAVRSHIYRVTVETDSEGVPEDELQTVGQYSVVGTAQPLILGDSLSDSGIVDLGFVGRGTDVGVALLLANQESGLPQARLQLNAAEWAGSPVLTTDLEVGQRLAAGDSESFMVTLDTSLAGRIESTLSLDVADDDGIFGATSTDLTVSFTGQIAIPGDADGDNEVSVRDFLLLSRHFDSGTTWQQGDFTDDGLVNVRDFLVLSRNFGERVEVSTVPEPGCEWLLWILAVVIVTRPRRNRATTVCHL